MTDNWFRYSELGGRHARGALRSPEIRALTSRYGNLNDADKGRWKTRGDVIGYGI